jgi:hypothetical protein
MRTGLEISHAKTPPYSFQDDKVRRDVNFREGEVKEGVGISPIYHEEKAGMKSGRIEEEVETSEVLWVVSRQYSMSVN